MKTIRILVESRSGVGNTEHVRATSCGKCLLCGNNRRGVNNDYYCGKEAGFKMLMRYLNIDVSKVLSNSVDGAAADRKGERDVQGTEVKLEEVTRSFCDGCESSVVKFWEVYQDFEVVRLQLEQSLHQLREHLESTNKIVKQVNSDATNEKDETFTGEILRKCILKLGSSPRVRMEEIGSCYKDVNLLPPPFAASKISTRLASEHHEQDESVPIIKKEESDRGSTNNSDDDDGDGDDYTPGSPEGPLSGTSSSSSTETDSEKSIGSCYQNISVPTAGVSTMSNMSMRMRKPKESFEDESVPVVKHEEALTGSTNNINDDNDDCDYVPDSQRSSVSAASSSESDSEESVTTTVHDPKHEKDNIQPSASNVKLTSCQKLDMLPLAKRIPRVKPCRICGKKFPTPKALHLHILLHSRDTTRKSIKCSYCPQLSADSLEHQQHVLCCHPIEFMGSDLPAGTTKQKLNLVLEQLLHQCDRVLVNENECFRCSICNSIFADTFDWRVHVMETHISHIVTTLLNQQRETETIGTELDPSSRRADTYKFKVCLHCGKRSKGRQNHRIHVREVHPFEYYPIPPGVNINERSFMECLSSACKQIVKSVAKKKTHWQCPFCKVSFNSRQGCKAHMCRKHLEAILSGTKSPPTKKSLHPNLHRNSNLSTSTKYGKCDYCGKEFSYPTLTQFRSHCVKHHCYKFLSDHVGQLPSQVTAINLEWAMESMMEESKLTTSLNSLHYQCPLCKGSKLFRVWTFRDHLLSDKHLHQVLPLLVERIEHSAHTTLNQDSHHETSTTATTSAIKIVTDDDPGNPVTCVHCGTVTRDKDKYREHLRRRHSYYYYIEKLPRNISEKDFNRTLKAMISESKLDRTPTTGMGYKCNLCTVMKSDKCGIKVHLLSKTHFPELLSRLKSKTDAATGGVASEESESDSERSRAASTSVVKSSSVSRNSSRPKLSSCRVCRKVFLNRKTLFLHMSCHINQVTTQACTYCSQSFNDPLEHQQHVFCNHADLFFAEELPKGTTKERLESVLQRLLSLCDRVVENNSESYKCSICNTPVGNPLQWTVHLWETHVPTLIEVLANKVEITKGPMGLDSLWTCKYCGKIATTASMHRRHLKSVHSFETYFHKFPPGTNVSEQAFTQSLLNACRSARKVVVNNKSRLQCPFCPVTVSCFRTWKAHVLDQHLTALISAATESCVKPNGSKRPQTFRPSKKSKKGKEFLCTFNNCGKVFANAKLRWNHSVSQHPFHHLCRSNKLPKGTTEEDLWMTIETMVEGARLPSSSKNDLNCQCTICDKPRLFRTDKFRIHLISENHLQEVIARLPKRSNSNNNSNSDSTPDEGIPIPPERKDENDDDDLMK